MSRSSTLVAVILILGLPGCKTLHSSASVALKAAQTANAIEPPRPNDWRLIASNADAARIGEIDVIWTSALADARTHGGAKIVTAEGDLLDPKAALPRPAPPPGIYHCRVVRMGLTAENHRKAIEAFKPFFCFVAVDGPLLTFTKGTGTHRPGGRLWDDGDARMVFLGSVAQQPDGPLPAYGDNPLTNQVGVVERIGDFRWRMVIPASTPNDKISVIELLPDAPVPTPRQGGQGASR